MLPERLGALVGAWRDPAAWEGTAEAGGVTMPAADMGVVALDELVLHGWDLARATGQPFRCDEQSTAAVLAFTTASAQPEFAGSRDGLFGPVVDVLPDAPAFDRALGLADPRPARELREGGWVRAFRTSQLPAIARGGLPGQGPGWRRRPLARTIGRETASRTASTEPSTRTRCSARVTAV